MDTTTENSEDAAVDRRLHDDRPQLGSALAGLKAKVVASVVHKQPARAGRYTLGRTLGSGCFGTVYEGRDDQLDRKVAVKIVDVHSDAGRARVVREAQLLASLSHPHVVSVFETGVTDDDPPAPYVVMELVRGGSLRQWLRAQPRAWREVVEVMLQAAQGVWAAHRAGIVHGDFKPDNVLLSADGRAQVVDFGLARFIGEPEDTAESDAGGPVDVMATTTGGSRGTPAYMAPEAFAGESTPLVDQYSLCVTLYEGLFGARPFMVNTVDELLVRLYQHDPALPKDRRGVPPAVGAALLRGLARKPEDRFGDLRELIAALEAGLRPPRTGRWLGLGLGATAVAAVAIGLALPRDAAPPPPADEAQAPAAEEAEDPVRAELRAEIEALRTLVQTAKLDQALPQAEALVERARALEHPPLLAELLLLQGQAKTAATDYEHAIPLVEQAYFLARDHDLPRIMAHAASELVGLWGYHADQYDDAHRWQKDAEVAFARAGLDPRQHPPYMSSVAGLMTRERDTEGAIAVLRESAANIAAGDRAGTSAHATTLRQLARELYIGQKTEEAVQIQLQALPMFAEHDGEQSFTYAGALDNLGVFLTALERYDEALAKHQQALKIREQVLPAGHLDLARSHGNLGRTFGLLGRIEPAISHTERSIMLFTERLGAGNATVAMGHETLGQIYASQGDAGREDALREYDKAARIYDGAGVIYTPTAQRVRTAIEAMGGTPPPKPSVPIPPEPEPRE